jgi:hypothetical protein
MPSSNRFLLFQCCFGLSLIFVSGSATFAQQEATVTRIEEDWELLVNTSDPETSAPQITTIMTPSSATSDQYFVFNLNHSTSPDYEKGGMQLHSWLPGDLHTFNESTTHVPLAANNELVKWTQRMVLQNGTVTMSVHNGTGATWGNFGDNQALSLSFDTNLENLNDYLGTDSVNFSSVGFAANRVSRLTLKSVRWYSGDSLVKEMTVSVKVHGE